MLPTDITCTHIHTHTHTQTHIKDLVVAPIRNTTRQLNREGEAVAGLRSNWHDRPWTLASPLLYMVN